MRGAAGPAEKVLRDLGIVRPEDIDLEVVAWHLGAKVKYRPLNTCEARSLAVRIGPSSPSTIGSLRNGSAIRSAMNSGIGTIIAAVASSVGRRRSAASRSALSIRNALRTAMLPIC